MTRSVPATIVPSGPYPAVRPSRRATWWNAPATTLALLALAVVGVVAMDPEHRHVPLCPFHSVTGLQCPFCGSLRAVYNLAHGRIGSALHDNLLFVLSVPIVTYLWWDGQRRRSEGRPERQGSRIVTVSVVCGLVVFTIARNLPVGSWLRPV